MSFFKKVLGSVGIGAAKVDAILDETVLAPGETITGVVKVLGGKVEQKINKIDLDLNCHYTVEKEREDSEGDVETYTVRKTHTLSRFVIEEPFVILPGETKEFSIEFDLSLHSPLSIGKSKTWLETNLDIDMALDKEDKDYLNVVPSDLQQAVIDAMESLGFQLFEADCEGVERVSFSRLPFVQELEFVPYSGEFKGQFDEVEIVFAYKDEETLEVLLEIDRRAKGLKGLFREVFDLDESNARIVVTGDNLEDVEGELYDLLEHSIH